MATTRYPDQWEHLARVERISPERLGRALKLGEEPRFKKTEWTSPLRQGDLFTSSASASEALQSPDYHFADAHEAQDLVVQTRVRERIYVMRDNLPDALQAKVRDLAMFKNPEYFRRKAARASTWKTPRVIRCAEVSDLSSGGLNSSEPGNQRRWSNFRRD